MFTKATFFAALVAGASAVSPAAYGGESYNNTTPYSPEQPKTYPAEYPSTSTTPSSPEEPKTYPAEYPSSKTDYEPTYPAEYPSTSSTPYSPHEPSTYASSSTTCTESTSTEEHPYKPTTDVHPYPSKFTKTSDDYTTATITATKVITVTAPHGTYVTTTESVYTTYCPKSDVTKYTKSAETTPYSPEKPTYSAPVYEDKKSSTKSVPYSPEQPKTYPAHGPLTTAVTKSYQKPVPTGYTTSEVVVDKTLTYTLGHGASTTVITTTVKSTSTIYLTKTVYANKSTKPTGEATTPAEIYPKPTGKTENSPQPNGGKPDYECKPQTVTVTAKETVYVTVPATSSTKSVVYPKKSSSAPYYPTKGNGYPVSSGVAKPTGFATYYTKPSAPVYKSKTDEYSPEKPTKSAPVYPVKSSSTEHKAEYPSTSSYESHPKPTYPAEDKHSSTYESHPTATYPAEEKPTYPATSVVYVTPVPSKDAEKPAGYGAEKPAAY